MYAHPEQVIAQLQAELKEAQADLASILGESPLWISLEGFNKVSDREWAWKQLAIEAQAFLAPTNPTWQAIEEMRNAGRRD